jgi:glycosyltransferase involved in cell wall biosynthesis
MEVVPQPVPDEAADEGGPAAEAAPHPRPYLIFVGRLERLKGLDDVLPLFRGGEGPDLLIAGTGNHEAELRRIATGSDRVRFLGHLPAGELARYYRGALALLMPSIGFETFGLSVVEAFRHSLPVVARAVGPLPEIVEQSGGGGILFRTPEELASSIQAIANDADMRRRMGERGRAAFTERWSEPATIPRYLDVVARATRTRDHAAV